MGEVKNSWSLARNASPVLVGAAETCSASLLSGAAGPVDDTCRFSTALALLEICNVSFIKPRKQLVNTGFLDSD